MDGAVECGIIGANPIANIKKRKAEPRVVSIDERILRELLKLPDQDRYTGLRDYCLILMTQIAASGRQRLFGYCQ